MSATNVNRFVKTKPAVLTPPAPPADDNDDTPDPPADIKFGKRKSPVTAIATQPVETPSAPAAEAAAEAPAPAKRRGRPPGVKNKAVNGATEHAANAADSSEVAVSAKKPRLGKPKGTLSELKRMLKQYEAELDEARDAYQKVRDQVSETLAEAEKAFRAASKIPVAQIGKLQTEILAMKTATD